MSGVGTKRSSGRRSSSGVFGLAAGGDALGLRLGVLLDPAALGHRLGLRERAVLLAILVLDVEDLAVGGLDLGAEAELDLDLAGEAFLLDRDRVQVVLGGLAGVADAQARGFDRGEVRDLAAVLAALTRAPVRSRRAGCRTAPGASGRSRSRSASRSPRARGSSPRSRAACQASVATCWNCGPRRWRARARRRSWSGSWRCPRGRGRSARRPRGSRTMPAPGDSSP
jgi:hypothetical protein